MLTPWKENYDKCRLHIKKQRHHFADKGLYNQRYCFSSSYGCESWMDQLSPKFWLSAKKLMSSNCAEKSLESPLDSKESNQSILKEINLEYSLERLTLKL